MADGPVNITAALRDMRENYKVMKEKTEECAKHDSLKLKKRNEEACQDCGNDPCTCDENLDPDTTNVDEGTWHIAKNMTKLKKAMKKPLHNFNLVAKHIGDDELWDDLGALKKGQDMVPAIKKAMKRLGI